MTEPTPPDPLLVPADFNEFASTVSTEKRQQMIDDALGLALFHAPCIATSEFAHRAAAKAIVRGAILRWIEAGSGAVVTQSTMSYGQTIDTRQPRRGMFYPSEIADLKRLCGAADDTGGAFNIDTLPAGGTIHSPVCNSQAWLGGGPCSCGANLTGTPGYPLWETHPDDGWA
jgi:hypothetical protein